VGQKVRISLTGRTEDRDGFGQIIELVPTARAGYDSGAELLPAGYGLGIFETEIYKPVIK
jgi:hypothetical protein